MDWVFSELHLHDYLVRRAQRSVSRDGLQSLTPCRPPDHIKTHILDLSGRNATSFYTDHMFRVNTAVFKDKVSFHE